MQSREDKRKGEEGREKPHPPLGRGPAGPPDHLVGPPLPLPYPPTHPKYLDRSPHSPHDLSPPSGSRPPCASTPPARLYALSPSPTFPSPEPFPSRRLAVHVANDATRLCPAASPTPPHRCRPVCDRAVAGNRRNASTLSPLAERLVLAGASRPSSSPSCTSPVLPELCRTPCSPPRRQPPSPGTVVLIPTSPDGLDLPRPHRALHELRCEPLRRPPPPPSISLS